MSLKRSQGAVVATIGYEGARMDEFLRALRSASVDLLVDVRAVTSSRRPGFSKNQLRANLAEVGIDYLHLRGLGTPAEGRSAARSGDHPTMRSIYSTHLETAAARDDMEHLARLVEAERKVALLCFEADPEHCHRSLVANELASRLGIAIDNLRPDRMDDA